MRSAVCSAQKRNTPTCGSEGVWLFGFGGGFGKANGFVTAHNSFLNLAISLPNVSNFFTHAHIKTEKAKNTGEKGNMNARFRQGNCAILWGQ